MPHIPVLLDEVLEALQPAGRTVERVIDGTLGAGGHTRALLDQGVGQVLGLDVDLQALTLARQTLAPFRDRVHVVHSSYADMVAQAAAIGWDAVDGILLDLGASSMQFDTPERGFAFRHDGPLDMRFDPGSNRPTAADLVNHWSAEALADIFFRYGEERHARRLARAIVARRPYETTQQLAAVIEQETPARRRTGATIHPATRAFQALRIAVNEELETVESTLPAAIDLLRPGGRLAVITFHSLEDRIVKQIFKDASTEIVAPPGMASIEEKPALVRLVNRKPITPGPAEVEHNPRSRSAKLRVVEKL